MAESERDLEEAVEELADILEDLQSELREPPTSPLGLPRPPTPGEFLRFTERYTLPTLISLLETSIRMLELLAASIRLVQREATESRRSEAPGAAVSVRNDRVASIGRATLDALDDALADLQSAAAGGEPASPELRRLVEDARDLGAEIDARLSDATSDSREEPYEIEIRDGSADEPADAERASRAGSDDAASGGGEAGEVDVDAELESIKDELDGREQPDEAHGTTEEPLEDVDEPAESDRARDADEDTQNADESG